MKGTDAANDARIAYLGQRIQKLQYERRFLVERMRRRRKQRRQAVESKLYHGRRYDDMAAA